VRVGANPAPKASTLVAPEDPVHVVAEDVAFVSRGGRKLDAALAAFQIDVEDVRAVDVGASTGGFTDCLLQRGASTVTAIDVGYGQLHWRIRQHPRVTVVERTNIRTVDPTVFGDPFDIVVADLSFISLRTVVEPMDALGSDTASWVLLIKPQFEVGRDDVGKGGIVRDPSIRRRAVTEVVDTYSDRGIHLHGLIASPITGTTGNVEYVAWFQRHSDGGRAVDDWLAAVEEPTP
jgi:23S rRNA (cytidine1920-2'-O)/16S rRNA (cytidine1409-2'-O)-methyltransferase